MPGIIHKNGDAAWNSMAKALEKIQENTSVIRERLAVVETKIDDRPCSDHADQIERMGEKVSEAVVTGRVNTAKLAGMSGLLAAGVSALVSWLTR